MALVIAAGLIAAGLHLVTRVRVETTNRAVELAVDYNEFADLAAQSGRSFPEVLRELRAAGVTSVGVDEMTIDRLRRSGLAATLRGGELLTLRDAPAPPDPAWARLDPAAIRPDALYLLFTDVAAGRWFEAAALRRLPAGTVDVPLPGRLVGVRIAEDRLDKQGFGVWPGHVAAVAQAGLYVIPRLQNYPPPEGREPGASPVRDLAGDLRAVGQAGGRVSTVIFGGGQAFGYPDGLPEAAAAFAQAGLVQGLVEAPVQLGFIRQLGQQEFAALTGYRAARVYSIHRAELNKLTPEMVLDRWPRAVKERNIRIIYARPLLILPGDEPPLWANLKLLRESAEALRRDGWTLGPAQPFAPVRPPAWVSVLIAAGVLAGGAWVVRLSLPLPPLLVGAAWLFAALAAGYALAFGRGDLTRKALALLAAVAFPSLGLAWAGWRASRAADGPAGAAPSAASAVREGVALVLAPAAISLIGAILLGALLADNRYLLEIEYFRGVKLSLVAPMAVAAWIAVRHWGVAGAGRWGAAGRNVPRELERLGGADLRAWHVALLGAAAVGAYIYLGRSGHTAGLEVSAAEVELRDWLERIFVARPRTKEFLVGYPALVAAAWFARRGWRPLVVPAVLAGGIALTSLVNSFEHMRTEFLLSLWRSANGVALGLLIGAAAVLVGDRLARLYFRWRADG